MLDTTLRIIWLVLLAIVSVVFRPIWAIAKWIFRVFINLDSPDYWLKW